MTKLYTSWTEQLPELANIYLGYKASNPCSTLDHYPAPEAGIEHIHIHCLDMFGELCQKQCMNLVNCCIVDGQSMEYIPKCPGELFPAYALVCVGYLCPTHMEPQLAISLQSLELLHSLFHVAPAFGFQHFAWLLADMHKVNCGLFHSPVTH